MLSILNALITTLHLRDSQNKAAEWSSGAMEVKGPILIICLLVSHCRRPDTAEQVAKSGFHQTGNGIVARKRPGGAIDGECTWSLQIDRPPRATTLSTRVWDDRRAARVRPAATVLAERRSLRIGTCKGRYDEGVARE